LLTTNDAKERLLMETRPRNPRHGDSVRGWETLSRDELLGSFADGEETEPQHDGLRQRTLEITFLESDAEPYSLTFG
jgi:hypothetical protein